MKAKYYLLIVLLFAAIFILQNNLFKNGETSTFISPLVESFKEIGIAQGPLADTVKNSLKGTKGTYAVVIKNLRTGESFKQNENRVFEPASLYKLWVIGASYKAIDEGKLAEDEVLSRDVKDLNKLFNIDYDVAEATEGAVTSRVDDALERMIVVSDNYSALLLASKIRNSYISSFIKSEGFLSSNLGQPPKTTPEDIALFYEKLYHGEIVNKEASSKILELLARQELNDRIPKYLPEGTKVAHKTGELGGFKHDAGIIFAKDPILFVVLSESTSPLGAAERIATLSRDVYNYFE